MKTQVRKTKPSMKTAKAMVTKQRKQKAQRNMDTFYLKAKNEGTIVPKQGVTVANYVYWAVDLDPYNSKNFGLSHINNAEFQLYKKMYDKYRINSLRVTVTPKANTFDVATAQNDSSFTLSGSGVIHTCIDRDSVAPSNISAITRYPSYRKYSTLKKFSRSYAVKYPQGVWIDCQQNNPVGNFGLSNELGLGGTVTMYAENFVEESLEIFNEPWAEVVVEYGIVFQGKTQGQLSFEFDEDGKVKSVCIEDHDVTESLPITEPKPRGTIADLRIVDDTTDMSVTDKGNA